MLNRVKIYLYREGKMRQYTIPIKPNNYYLVKFLVKKELERIRNRLRNLQEKGYIKSIKKPKIGRSRYRKEILFNLEARKSLLESNKVLKEIKQTFKNL